MQTILFLHGWGGDEWSFAPILPAFENFYNCITISLPMDTPDSVWKLDDYADFVFLELDRRNITKCHLIAHSFGCRVALTMLNKNPDIFMRMVLTGAAAIPRRRNLWRWLRIKLHKTGVWRGRGSSDYRKLSQSGKLTFQNIIRADLRPLIKKFDIPTLLIYGSRDTATPLYMAKRWTRIAPNAKLLTYKGTGHFCYVTSPARFISDALEFLKGADT